MTAPSTDRPGCETGGVSRGPDPGGSTANETVLVPTIWAAGTAS
ncbi:hypothetical protein OG275_02915 [Streptomyces niveus]|nr:hypothetical protein [Streptomyces niveus]